MRHVSPSILFLFLVYNLIGQSNQSSVVTNDSIDYFFNNKNKIQYLHHTICKDSMILSQKEIKKIIELYQFPETKTKLQTLSLFVKKETRRKNTNLITASVLFATSGLVYLSQSGLGHKDVGVVGGAVYFGFGCLFVGVFQSHKIKARNYKKQFVELHNKFM